MIIFIAALIALAAVGGATTIHAAAKDGFGRVPTRIM